MSQVKHIRKRIEELDQLASSLTGLSMEYIAQMRFEVAYEVLQKQIGTDAYGMEMLPQQATFWGWWRKEWLRVDELLFEGVAGRPAVVRFDVQLMMAWYQDEYGRELRITDQDDMASLYIFYHSANSVVYKQYPWLWESFNKEVIKQQLTINK